MTICSCLGQLFSILFHHFLHRIVLNFVFPIFILPFLIIYLLSLLTPPFSFVSCFFFVLSLFPTSLTIIVICIIDNSFRGFCNLFLRLSIHHHLRFLYNYIIIDLLTHHILLANDHVYTSFYQICAPFFFSFFLPNCNLFISLGIILRRLLALSQLPTLHFRYYIDPI